MWSFKDHVLGAFKESERSDKFIRLWKTSRIFLRDIYVQVLQILSVRASYISYIECTPLSRTNIPRVSHDPDEEKVLLVKLIGFWSSWRHVGAMGISAISQLQSSWCEFPRVSPACDFPKNIPVGGPGSNLGDFVMKNPDVWMSLSRFVWSPSLNWQPVHRALLPHTHRSHDLVVIKSGRVKCPC